MEKKINARLSTRLLALLMMMGLGLIAASMAWNYMTNMGMMAWLTIQDVLAFIVPAVIAMAIFYRSPCQAMCLDRAPGWTAIGIIVAFYVVSLPAMNWITTMNQTMTLPSWMSGIEQTIRSLEDSAADATNNLFKTNGIWDTIVCISVVGLLAGLSEEMLYRGAMLRMMQDSRMGVHTAVWIVAIIFSAIHMQFYGFLPRMLIGVWLGYLLVCTRSLWAPIIAHVLNNSVYVVLSLLAKKGIIPKGFDDSIGLPAPGAFPWLALLSLIASIALVVWTYKHYSAKQR